jgi:hypothetical protein
MGYMSWLQSVESRDLLREDTGMQSIVMMIDEAKYVRDIEYTTLLQ